MELVNRPADVQANMIKSYIDIYSCEQIAFEEADRISSKMREQYSDWQCGQGF